jgi:hypothetical protein
MEQYSGGHGILASISLPNSVMQQARVFEQHCWRRDLAQKTRLHSISLERQAALDFKMCDSYLP